ncbi:hypothetical protein [Arthrobacter sp. CAN_C5]|nr:hypothetical protein [Arthrobacter sp. CAN_C5]MBP2215079.1 hypothetical protein [Arthrobacter sp. CAN_C5]
MKWRTRADVDVTSVRTALPLQPRSAAMRSMSSYDLPAEQGLN